MRIVHTTTDTGPIWYFRCFRRGKPMPLTAPGAAITCKVRLSDASVVTKAAVIDNAVGGECHVTWASNDIDVVGEGTVELVYTATGGISQHSKRPIRLTVRAEYSDPEP